MNKLVNIILQYESDTFNARALGVSQLEAHLIAERLYRKLCEVVEKGGMLRCDGDVLSGQLDDIRSS